jgi:hypothetical protein
VRGFLIDVFGSTEPIFQDCNLVELLIKPLLLLSVYLSQLLVLRVKGLEFALHGLNGAFEIEVLALERLETASDEWKLLFKEKISLVGLYLA